MRILLAIFFLFISAAPLMACEGFENDMKALEAMVGPQATYAGPKTASFARELSSDDELWRWTQTSTLGGGRVEEAEFGGEKFVFAFRSYTSGVKSSDAAVYMKDGEGWKLVKAYPLVMGKWIVADKQADRVVFHPEGESKSLMVLNKADFAEF